MNDLWKSGFVFDLIDEFQIISNNANSNQLTDEAFELFCTKYVSYSQGRDSSLLYYINSNQNLFRCTLPDSKWSFSVALNTVWYYDEVILIDPVIKLLNNTNYQIEGKKKELLNILNFFSNYKESIEGGYILFVGNSHGSNQTDFYKEESLELLKSPEVLAAFERLTPMGKKSSPINDNEEDNLTQLLAQYHGHWMESQPMSMYIPPHVMNSPSKLSKGVFYDFVSPFQPLTKEEVLKLGKGDFLEQLKLMYKDDISIILNGLNIAQTLNTPTLFFRNVDIVVAQKYADDIYQNPTHNIVDGTIYDCLVPYIDGLPSERLFEIRSQIPQAFLDFRYFLFEILNKAKSQSTDIKEIKYIVKSEINKRLHGLEVEINNANRKAILQAISSTVMLFGSLQLSSFSTLLGSGGVINGISTISNLIEKRKNASINPLYFLWKANQKK